jgi:hypothetical protein
MVWSETSWRSPSRTISMAAIGVSGPRATSMRTSAESGPAPAESTATAGRSTRTLP